MVDYFFLTKGVWRVHDVLGLLSKIDIFELNGIGKQLTICIIMKIITYTYGHAYGSLSAKLNVYAHTCTCTVKYMYIHAYVYRYICTASYTYLMFRDAFLFLVGGRKPKRGAKNSCSSSS